MSRMFTAGDRWTLAAVARTAVLTLLPVLSVMAAHLPALSAQAQTATTVSPKTDAVWTTVWDHWYVMEVADATAGWMRDHVTSRGDEYRSESEMMFKLRRGASEIELRMSSVFRETRDGTPISLRSVQNMGQQPVETLWEFNEDHVRSVTNVSRVIEKRLPLPEGSWLTPMGTHSYWLERMKSDAKEITYRTIDDEHGLDPISVTHVRQGAEQFEVAGRSVPVSIWKTTSSALPGMHSITRISADGHMVCDETVLPFGKVVTRLVTKHDALAGAAGPAPEMMLRTFVEADPPIMRVRETTSSILRLRTRDGKMPELPSAGAQRVEVEDGGRSALLHIDIEANLPADAGDAKAIEYTESTTMIDAEDALIRKLARNARRGADDDPLSRADALRAFVHRHISSKSLDTAFASASETARMRAGDCSEHAVLLCAMMRASGLPARVASGLVYADYFSGERDIFGWHMWTQANIDGRWIDFDATLDQRYDAAHVLIGTSSLADGIGGMDMASMMMLMGNLEIEVLNVAY